MKIGVVTSAYHPDVGGVETHTRRLCAALTAAGDRVDVLTQHPTGSRESIDGVLVRRFPLTVASPNYRFSLELWRWLRRHATRYDVLHAHSYHALAALPAAVTNRTPLVFTPHYHGTGHSRLRAALHPIYRPVGRRIVARSSRIICVTRAERDLLVRDFPEAVLTHLEPEHVPVEVAVVDQEAPGIVEPDEPRATAAQLGGKPIAAGRDLERPRRSGVRARVPIGVGHARRNRERRDLGERSASGGGGERIEREPREGDPLAEPVRADRHTEARRRIAGRVRRIADRAP